MGIVTFSTKSLRRSVGIRIEDRVVPVSSIHDEDSKYTKDYLSELESLYVSAKRRVHNQSRDTFDVQDVTFHQPVTPSKIIRLEGCYSQDLSDTGFNPFIESDGLNEMDWPSHFAIPNSATVPSNEPIALPKFADEVRPGVELVFVVGKKVRQNLPSVGLDAIAGCMVAVNIAVYDELPGLFGYKMLDSALPLSREIIPTKKVDMTNLDISLSINDEELATNTTANWRFHPDEIVNSVTDLMTVYPGDLIVTGDPIRTEYRLKAEDELSARIENVGVVTSTVARETETAGVQL